ncbi:hypothetical protein GCM10023185_46820 [Hymenobacter saemangeumensis]|uniref:AB hydrolase-1 domain-containing protein n=1 Tax=Hymenobacter saemangeumensis TaxID=1084522 RepID=A0ABP8IT06_9BACT
MKQALLLLHGALGSAAQLQSLADLLKESAAVYTLSFSGHGGEALLPEKFTMQHFAGQVQEFVDTLGSGPVHVFGYSMGGYAALLAAQQAPQQFASITTLGTKFDWSPATAEEATRFLDPEKMLAKVPAFAEQLRQLHAPTAWQAVVTGTAALMRGLGEQPPLTPDVLATIKTPTLVLVGDADNTAGPEASRSYAAHLPQAGFEVLPATSHPLERVDVALLTDKILGFMARHPAG